MAAWCEVHLLQMERSGFSGSSRRLGVRDRYLHLARGIQLVSGVRRSRQPSVHPLRRRRRRPNHSMSLRAGGAGWAIAHQARNFSSGASNHIIGGVSGMGASRRRSPSCASKANQPSDILGRMRKRGSTNRRRSRIPGGGPALRRRRSASVGCTSHTVQLRPRSSVNSRKATGLTSEMRCVHLVCF